MILLYFKQAWNMLKQERLFSSIHIIGTGLSITIVMILSIVYYIKIANIYPETNRDRTLYIQYVNEEGIKESYYRSGNISVKLIEDCFNSMDGIEAISLMEKNWDEEHYIQLTSNKEQLPVTIKFIDVDFWTVNPFKFIEGKQFSDSDFESGILTAVISSSTAKRIFGRTNVVGEYVSLDFKQYRICGVVKDASFVTNRTYANLWIPYTTRKYYLNHEGQTGYSGPMEATILASTHKDIESIKQRAVTWNERYNRSNDEVILKLNGQPDKHWQYTFRFFSNVIPDFRKILIGYSLIFLILLLVPAISLSGMTDSRMERRLGEMGIRRAFGAPSRQLIGQIISENLVFTILGGAAGLLFSYLLILLCADWIMTIGQIYMDLPLEGTKLLFTPSMLINIPVFLIALSVCFILNLMTALIPAWRASHKDIIHSLNAKQ